MCIYSKKLIRRWKTEKQNNYFQGKRNLEQEVKILICQRNIVYLCNTIQPNSFLLYYTLISRKFYSEKQKNIKKIIRDRHGIRHVFFYVKKHHA